MRKTTTFEMTMAVSLLLLIGAGVVEFGRAYQTWQVLMSAAREGAKVAVVAGSTDAQVESAVRTYMTSEHLPYAATTPVVLDRHVTLGPATATQVTIKYPFELKLLKPAPLTMSAVAIMRNES